MFPITATDLGHIQLSSIGTSDQSDLFTILHQSCQNFYVLENIFTLIIMQRDNEIRSMCHLTVKA